MPSPTKAQPATSPLTAPEVRQLWWFLDGAIMHADTRIELRRNWGLCSRHAWALALVESELRGGVLFATSVLYADLAAGAAHECSGTHLRSLMHRLGGEGRCLTCHYAAHANDEPPEWRERAGTVNRRARFSASLLESWEDAVQRSCPACCGGEGPACRPHLLNGTTAPDDLGTRLRRLAIAIHAYEKSLTADGRPVDRRGRAAWLETLGWFAGWEFPAELVREQGTPSAPT